MGGDASGGGGRVLWWGVGLVRCFLQFRPVPLNNHRSYKAVSFQSNSGGGQDTSQPSQPCTHPTLPSPES